MWVPEEGGRWTRVDREEGDAVVERERDDTTPDAILCNSLQSAVLTPTRNYDCVFEVVGSWAGRGLRRAPQWVFSVGLVRAGPNDDAVDLDLLEARDRNRVGEVLFDERQTLLVEV